MRIFRRPKDKNGADASATEFLWGVPRREGHSDTDDPLAHAGAIQHAFEFGRDDRAICGFEPPKRTSRVHREPRPQLAVPGRDNPRCRRCDLLVASLTRGEEQATGVIEFAALDTDPRNGRDIEGDRSLGASMIGGMVADAETKAEPDEQGPGDEQVPEDDHAPEGARQPGFHPRAGSDAARTGSVRRGGSTQVASGRRSVVVEIPPATDLAGIVANVEPEIRDVRVAAVTVGNDGTARITLNQPAPEAVQVVWYIVSNPGRETD